MKENINVATGEVKFGNRDNCLSSNAIGSCIVITALDSKLHIGALAHIMLPGKALTKEIHQKTKYADNAITQMLDLLAQNGSTLSNLTFCLVGAGNVLQKKNDTICNSNIDSVVSILTKKNLQVSQSSLGGILRRSVRFDIKHETVYITIGDSKEIILWKSSTP